MFTGSFVALITPFSDGQVDFETLDELVEFHLNSGTDGIALRYDRRIADAEPRRTQGRHRTRRQPCGRPSSSSPAPAPTAPPRPSN